MSTFVQNAHLDGNPFELKGNRICVLLFHGFTATTVEVRPLSEFLHKNGFSVIAPLLPGHNSNPESLKQTKWQDWVKHAEEELQKCLEKYERVFVGGESMGGLISCYLAIQYPNIAGLLLFAPALRVKNLEYARFLKYIIPHFGDGTAPEEQKEKFPWKGYTIKPTSALAELYKLQKLVRGNLHRINQPAIIFQGANDKTIDPESSRFVFDNIASKENELIILKKSGHCVILDWEFDQIAEKTLQFLGRLS